MMSGCDATHEGTRPAGSAEAGRTTDFLAEKGSNPSILIAVFSGARGFWGSRRFETVDESRNNPFTAFFAAGEGWHNNHHRYQRAARNGFYWWEYDITWYVIRAMGAVGLVWDIQPVPERIYEEARAVKQRRAGAAVPSVVDAGLMELAKEPE